MLAQDFTKVERLHKFKKGTRFLIIVNNSNIRGTNLTQVVPGNLVFGEKSVLMQKEI